MQASPAQTSKKLTCGGKRKDGSACKAELDSESDFCGKCGTPIPKARRVCTGKRKNGQPCDYGEVAEDFDFCPKCGTPVSEEEPETPEKEYCRGKRKNGTPCQAELVPGQDFCGKCGTPSGAGADNEESQAEEKKTDEKEIAPEPSANAQQPTGGDGEGEKHEAASSPETSEQDDGPPKDKEKEASTKLQTTKPADQREERESGSPDQSGSEGSTTKQKTEGSSDASGAGDDSSVEDSYVMVPEEADSKKRPEQHVPTTEKTASYSAVAQRGIQESSAGSKSGGRATSGGVSAIGKILQCLRRNLKIVTDNLVSADSQRLFLKLFLVKQNNNRKMPKKYYISCTHEHCSYYEVWYNLDIDPFYCSNHL